MMFGKSLFQSVVDRLSHEADVTPEAAMDDGMINRVAGLRAGFVAGSTGAATSAAAKGAEAYRRVMEEFKPDPPPASTPERQREPRPPAWLNRLSQQDIREDLGLSPDDDREALQEKRRRFARDNHPDRVDQRFAEAATTRMKIANLLIDDAIRTGR